MRSIVTVVSPLVLATLTLGPAALAQDPAFPVQVRSRVVVLGPLDDARVSNRDVNFFDDAVVSPQGDLLFEAQTPGALYAELDGVLTPLSPNRDGDYEVEVQGVTLVPEASPAAAWFSADGTVILPARTKSGAVSEVADRHVMAIDRSGRLTVIDLGAAVGDDGAVRGGAVAPDAVYLAGDDRIHAIAPDLSVGAPIIVPTSLGEVGVVSTRIVGVNAQGVLLQARVRDAVDDTFDAALLAGAASGVVSPFLEGDNGTPAESAFLAFNPQTGGFCSSVPHPSIVEGSRVTCGATRVYTSVPTDTWSPMQICSGSPIGLAADGRLWFFGQKRAGDGACTGARGVYALDGTDASPVYELTVSAPGIPGATVSDVVYNVNGAGLLWFMATVDDPLNEASGRGLWQQSAVGGPFELVALENDYFRVRGVADTRMVREIDLVGLGELTHRNAPVSLNGAGQLAYTLTFSDDSSAVMLTNSERAGVDLEVRMATSTLGSGGAVRYDITVANIGGASALEMELTLVLPAGHTYDARDINPAECRSPIAGTVRCSYGGVPDLALLNSGDELSLAIHTWSNGAAGTATLTVATETANDRDPSNNGAEIGVPGIEQTDLGITYDETSRTWTVTNLGPLDATNVVVVQTVQNDAGGNTTTTPVGDLAVNESRTSVPVLTIADTTFLLDVASDQVDPELANNTVSFFIPGPESPDDGGCSSGSGAPPLWWLVLPLLWLLPRFVPAGAPSGSSRNLARDQRHNIPSS